jgi:hypothetical protein
VVVQGRLEELTTSNLDTALTEAIRGLDIPYFKVQKRPVDDLEFHTVRLNVTSMNGIVEG